MPIANPRFVLVVDASVTSRAPIFKVSNVALVKLTTLLVGSKRFEANFHFPESEASLINPVWYFIEAL